MLILQLCALIIFTASKTATASSCTNCDGANATCVDGECLPRCVNVTPSGECLQCQDSRFYGKQCENDCPNTCLNSSCEENNSRVVCTDECVAGKKGDNCGVDCPAGCAHCKRYDDRCIGLCKSPQYYGETCSEACPVKCNGTCDRHNGECNGCKQSFRGRFCNESCAVHCTECEQYGKTCTTCYSWYYGPDCNLHCPEHCEVCNKITGECTVCFEGHGRTSCGDPCQPCAGENCQNVVCKEGVTSYSVVSTAHGSASVTDDGSSTILKIVIGFVTVVVLLLSALFVAIIWGLRHRCRKRLQVKQAEQRSSDASDQSGRTQYWASKYWEIDDNDLDTDLTTGYELPARRDPCPILQQQGQETSSNCLLKYVNSGPYQRMSTTTRQDSDSIANESLLLDLESVMDNHLYRSAEVGADCAQNIGVGQRLSVLSVCPEEIHNTSGGQTRCHPKQTAVTSEDRSVCSVTRKTEPKKTLDPHTDISRVSVKYITPNLTVD